MSKRVKWGASRAPSLVALSRYLTRKVPNAKDGTATPNKSVVEGVEQTSLVFVCVLVEGTLLEVVSRGKQSVERV